MILSKFFKKSIWSKVFIMNLLILVFIVFVQLIFQALFFEKYYLNKKKKILQEEVISFENYLYKEINFGNGNPINIMNYIEKVNVDKEIYISLKESDLTTGIFIDSYMNSNYILLKDSTSKIIYKVILGDLLTNIDLNVGDNIEVIGYTDIYGYIMPNRISINGIEIPLYNTIIPSTSIIDTKLATIYPSNSFINEICIKGSLRDPTIKKNTFLNYTNVLSELPVEIKNNILNHNNYSTILKNNIDTSDFLISSKYFDGNYIIAMIPLTAVADVLNTMDSFYLIIFLFALIFVAVTSIIYSNLITKPLIDMSKVANEISKSNFDATYNVKSEDEIGLLGSALNSIGSNFKNTLKDLKVSNEKLKEEMNIKKIQDEKRKELVANISHELKTPITIIQGNIEGFKKGVYTHDIFTDILEETTRMNSLVMEMLEVSKLEEPTFKLNLEFFDLYNSTLKEMDKLKSLYLEKNITVLLKVDEILIDEELVVLGDEKRIGEVIRNLMTNAIKYTPNYEKVEISLQDVGSNYLFRIENFGIVLNEEDLKNIWDAFYRSEKSRNKKLGGTGLGLYIVKRILALHNSTYGVESDSNSVVFYFTLNKGIF